MPQLKMDMTRPRCFSGNQSDSRPVAIGLQLASLRPRVRLLIRARRLIDVTRAEAPFYRYLPRRQDHPQKDELPVLLHRAHQNDRDAEHQSADRQQPHSCEGTTDASVKIETRRFLVAELLIVR